MGEEIQSGSGWLFTEGKTVDRERNYGFSGLKTGDNIICLKKKGKYIIYMVNG